MEEVIFKAIGEKASMYGQTTKNVAAILDGLLMLWVTSLI